MFNLKDWDNQLATSTREKAGGSEMRFHCQNFWPMNYTSYNGFVVVSMYINTTETCEKCGIKACVLYELERRDVLHAMVMFLHEG